MASDSATSRRWRRCTRPWASGSCACFPDWEAGVFTGNPPLGRALSLRAYRSHTLFNGATRVPAAALPPEARTPSSRIRRSVRRARLEAAQGTPGRGDVREPSAQELRRSLPKLGKARRTWRASASTTPTCPSTRSPSTSTATTSAGSACRSTRRRRPCRTRPRGRVATRSCRCCRTCSAFRRSACALRVRRRQKAGEQYEKVDERSAIPRRARRALSIPGQFHRLPRHRPVPRSPPHARDASGNSRTGGVS